VWACDPCLYFSVAAVNLNAIVSSRGCNLIKLSGAYSCGQQEVELSQGSSPRSKTHRPLAKEFRCANSTGYYGNHCFDDLSR